jgi:hypothetical protein
MHSGITIDWNDTEYKLTRDNIEQVYRELAPEIVNTTLEYLESKDPTPNKQYVPWMVKSIINDPQFRWEDFNRDNILNTYERLKQGRRIRPEHTDINKFPTFTKFEDTMREYYKDLLVDRVVDRGESEILLDNSDIKVIQPLDETASCYYGQGTRWCTAATRGPNYFETYNERGPLMIIIPKKPEYRGEKYQLWLDQNDINEYQFMDEEDKVVNLPKLVKNDPRFRTLVDISTDVKRFINGFTELMSPERLDAYISIAQGNVENLIDEYFTTVNDESSLTWDKEKFKMDVGGLINSSRIRQQLESQATESAYNPLRIHPPTLNDIYLHMAENVESGLGNTEFEYNANILGDWIRGLDRLDA